MLEVVNEKVKLQLLWLAGPLDGGAGALDEVGVTANVRQTPVRLEVFPETLLKWAKLLRLEVRVEEVRVLATVDIDANVPGTAFEELPLHPRGSSVKLTYQKPWT